MSPEETDLLHRYLNGDLDGAEGEAFRRRLADSPDLRRALASFALDEALLSEIVLENRARAPKARLRRWALLPTAAAAAVLLFGLYLLLRVPSVVAAGRLTAASGDVSRPAGSELHEGDEIRLGKGARAAAELTGSVSFVSEKGRARGAAGSRLTVSVSESGMRVEVEQGSAEIGGVSVTAGHYGLAGAAIETGRLVDRARVDAAVARACRFLESRRGDLVRTIRDGQRHAPAPPRTYAELALLALLDSGLYRESDPIVNELLGPVLARRIESTYTAALRAIVLARLDPVKHQAQIRECAEYLSRTQCGNGQWDYGEAHGPARPNGDNSCSAYAALGLKACAEAGVAIDREVARRARAWWLQSQNADGGWGYHEFGRVEVEASPKADAASNASYGSMTASGATSVLALSRLLGEEYAAHASVRRAVEWLAKNHLADRNPGKAAGFSHLHYGFALQRLGLALGTERFGGHEWHAGGVEFLLSRQSEAGFWKVEGEFMKNEAVDVLDTCLALLLLRRSPSW